MSDWDIYVACLIAAPVFGALIGLAIGLGRGRAAFGFFAGALLGPLGWLIIIVLPRRGRKCPFCLGIIPQAATRCQHCAAELPGSGRPRRKRGEEFPLESEQNPFR